jgi:hypothetical protein
MSKPVAVIRTLEDSPDWLDRRLVEAYLRTGYRVNPTPDPSPERRGDVECSVERNAVYAASPLLSGEGPGVGLRIAHLLPAPLADWLSIQNISTLTVVTAWNPRSKIVSEKENRLKNKDLEVELQKVSRRILYGLNVSDTGDWPPEESFWALDIPTENAVLLGKQFEQNAIVWWEKGGMSELWWL